MRIGDKIKALRKNKDVTQAELACALSVSSQSVSKWENHLSSPDISVLPAIARYFGITMDELFGYRLDVMNYKERFIRFMFDNGMLRFGEFTLKSGRISPYLVCSGYYRTGSQISKLGEFYAECIRAHSIETNCLVGVSERDVPILIATGMTLFREYGVESRCCLECALGGDDSEVGEMTLLTDVFTSGATLRAAIDRIYSKMGRYPSNIVVCVDRAERSETSVVSAKHGIENMYGVKIHSIVNVKDVIRAGETGVIPIGDYLERLKVYETQYEGE